jgi:hypothetical protein
LAEQKADRFDPARFCYIAALVRRSASKPPTVRRRLEEKALEAIDGYRKRFETARKGAAARMARLATTHPDKAKKLSRCFDQCDFTGLRRVADRVEGKSGPSVLAALNDQLAMTGRLANQNAAQGSLYALLQQQEEALVASSGNSPDRPDAPTSMRTIRLRAFHFFEEDWARHHAETVVEHAIGHVPENPGHLNTQMLVTRSLAAMRRLSPDYLHRWVSHMETLLWLEEAGREDPSRLAKAHRQA